MKARRTHQNGMTLVELMVAMAVGLVVLAATAALVAARIGFATVDSASQLRDNSRFAADLVNRILVQGGYEDITYAISTRKLDGGGPSANPQPQVSGFNDASIATLNPLLTKGTGGVNGSDVLMVRYQAGETFPGSGIADRTMIDCQGNWVTTVATDRDDRMASIFHVAINNGEPSLMCTTVTGSVVADAQPMVQGVESFQVLYGVDGVVPGTAPAATLAAAVRADRYLRADQMLVGGDVNGAGTYANWRRVRSIRIGMVLRAAAGSTQDPASKTLYPFGVASSSAGGRGAALSSSADSNTVFVPPADGRLRQVVSFTVHLRNAQDLKTPAVKP